MESGLKTAEKRLKVLTNGPLKKAAAELQIGSTLTVPVTRSLQPAIEELAEAFCLLQYLKTCSKDEIPSWKSLQNIFSVNLILLSPYLSYHIYAKTLLLFRKLLSRMSHR